MKLFICNFDYLTAKERGWGEIVVTAENAAEAEVKAQMHAGAWSDATNVSVREVPGGAMTLSHRSEDVEKIEAEQRERSVAPRFEFVLGAKATVRARDRWEAFRKFGDLVKRDRPPDGLARKVLEQTPLDGITSAEANSIFKEMRMFQGGAARPK